MTAEAAPSRAATEPPLLTGPQTVTDALSSEIATGRTLRTVAAKKGNGVTPPDNSHLPTEPCPWCGDPVTIAKVGGHTRRFCSDTNHRNLYNSAIRRLAISQADLIMIPGALQKWDSASCTTPGSEKWLSSLLGEG